MRQTVMRMLKGTQPFKGNEMISIKSGHDIHFEKPDEFITILVDF